MNEKLKGFLSKDDPSDEELELFLFAMNQQEAGVFGAIKRLVDHVMDHAEMVDAWVIPRLRSDAQITEGLQNEMRIAMRTLEDLRLSLENASEYVEMRSNETFKKYRKADVAGGFFRKEKDGQMD